MVELNLKWCFVGASTIASQWMIEAVRKNGGHIASVVSGDQARAQSYANDHHIERGFSNLTEALSHDIDAVYISSTNEKHFPQAMAAIDAGKHVLCEKPLAMSMDEAKAMVSAANSKNLVFGTNHHLRCSGSHRAIKTLIDEGRVGQVLSIRVHHAVYLPPHLQGWRINAPDAGGGVIPDITVHNADVVRFLLGEDPISIVGSMTSSGMGEGVEDSAMSIWSMPSGAMIFSHESFTHAFAGSGLQVHGTKGSIFANGVMTQQPIGSIELVTQEGRENIPFSDHNLYVESVRRFVEAVGGQGTPAATGIDGIKSLYIASQVKEAAQTGQRMTLNYEILK